MPSFKTVTMKNSKGQEYQIDLSLNDAAIMDDNLEIEVTGRYRENRNDHWQEEVFTVRMVSGERLIHVIFHDKVIGTIDLNNFGDVLDESFDELDGLEAWKQIQEFFSENGGEIIEETGGGPHRLDSFEGMLSYKPDRYHGAHFPM